MKTVMQTVDQLPLEFLDPSVLEEPYQSLVDLLIAADEVIARLIEGGDAKAKDEAYSWRWRFRSLLKAL